MPSARVRPPRDYAPRNHEVRFDVAWLAGRSAIGCENQGRISRVRMCRRSLRASQLAHTERAGVRHDLGQVGLVARAFEQRTTPGKPDDYIVASHWWALAELQT